MMDVMKRALGLALFAGACGAHVTDNPWSTPTPVPGASSAEDEDDGTASSTMLELFFSYSDPADMGRKHLHYMTRATLNDAWSDPQPMPFEVMGSTDQTPRLTSDDLTMYFASDRGTTNLDIWRVSRFQVGATWGAPEPVTEVNDAMEDDKWLSPCDDDRYLMVSSRGSNHTHVYEGVLGSTPPAFVDALSSDSSETGPWLSASCLTVYFASSRSGDNRLYTA